MRGGSRPDLAAAGTGTLRTERGTMGEKLCELGQMGAVSSHGLLQRAPCGTAPFLGMSFHLARHAPFACRIDSLLHPPSSASSNSCGCDALLHLSRDRGESLSEARRGAHKAPALRTMLMLCSFSFSARKYWQARQKRRGSQSYRLSAHPLSALS